MPRGPDVAEPTPAGFGAEVERRHRDLAPLVAYGWNAMIGAAGARERFIRYLVEAYHWVRHTCPLLERAAARAADLPWLAEYLRAHAEEERGHDELLLKDLERLGRGRAEVQGVWPRRETLALVAAQVHLMDTAGPVTLLGHAYALEATPPTSPGIVRLSSALDVPQDALTALRVHADADPGHVRELRAMLDRLTDPERQRLVLYSLEITSGYLADLLLALATEDLSAR